MSQKEFFDEVRRTVFGGSLTAQQVSGITRIIEYRDTQYRGVTNDQLAYILATVFLETGRRMCPCKEQGSLAYLKAKRYFPYIGVGLVQCTWKGNWDRYGIKKAEDGLTWPVALLATFDGMVRGRYTGKKLSDYISGTHIDFVGARRIINGTDKASQIAAYARSFQHALRLWQPTPRVATSNVKPHPPEEKTIFDQIGDFFGIGGEERAAAPNAPMPPPVPAPLSGMSGYTLAAIVAAVGALQTIPWDEVIRNPSVGYPMILSAVGIAVARAVLPGWLQFFILKGAT